jgi:hypothetical protein
VHHVQLANSQPDRKTAALIFHATNTLDNRGGDSVTAFALDLQIYLATE